MIFRLQGYITLYRASDGRVNSRFVLNVKWRLGFLNQKGGDCQQFSKSFLGHKETELGMYVENKSCLEFKKSITEFNCQINGFESGVSSLYFHP